MKVLVGIGLAMISLWMMACGNESGENQENAMDQTNQKITDSTEFKQDSKLEEINNKIVADPKNPENFHDRAYYHFHNGNIEDAIADAKKCIELDPNSAEYYFTKGFMFHASLQLSEAETAFIQCLDLDPEYVEAHHFLAKIYQARARPEDLDKFNYQKARESINEALKIDETRPDLYFLRATIYEELGDSGAALGSYKTAVELDPNYYDAFIRMGLLYASVGNPKAVTSYESALAIKPNSTEARFDLGKYYQDFGEYDKAEKNYLEVVEIDSFYAIAYLNLGYMYMTYDTAYTKAIEYLHRAVYFNSGGFLPLTYFNIGVAFELQGKYKKARKYYKTAIERDNNYRPALDAINDLDRKGLGIEEEEP